MAAWRGGSLCSAAGLLGLLGLLGPLGPLAPPPALGQQAQPPADPAAPDDPGAPADRSAASPVPFPHPLITEVLFAVPTSGGDANGDGQRHATGDELVELVNPNDRPISLTGYRLRDRNASESSRFDFTFPPLTLEPAEAVVVFNGLKAQWRGPVGDASLAAPEAHPNFERAWVFTARAATRYVSFANSADWVLLESPIAQPVQAVVWGEPDDQPPERTPLVERVPANPGSSVQRESVGGPLRAHRLLDGRPHSPGVPLPVGAADQHQDGSSGGEAGGR